MSKSKKPLRAKEIASELKKTSVNIRKILSNLCKEEKVERVVYGKYISLEISKQWRKDNPEYAKQYYKNNLEKVKERSKQWYKNNLEYMKKYAKKYYKNNLEKVNKCHKQWRKNNIEEVRKYHNQYQKDRDKIDLKFNLNRKIGKAICQSLKINNYGQSNKKGRHWEPLVGYTLNDLLDRLRKTMPAGYTWKDYLTGDLHIDHIIPISAFNFTRPEHTDFKRCWELENLQLLPAKENLIKHNNLDKPFQPALKI
ncbi:hypothetical protein ES705_46988 [subsurface metagenome]